MHRRLNEDEEGNNISTLKSSKRRLNNINVSKKHLRAESDHPPVTNNQSIL